MVRRGEQWFRQEFRWNFSIILGGQGLRVQSVIAILTRSTARR